MNQILLRTDYGSWKAKKWTRITDNPVKYEKIAMRHFRDRVNLDEKDILFVQEIIRSLILQCNSVVTTTKLAHLYDNHYVCMDVIFDRIYLANDIFPVFRKHTTVYSENETIRIRSARKRINHSDSNAKSLL